MCVLKSRQRRPQRHSTTHSQQPSPHPILSNPLDHQLPVFQTHLNPPLCLLIRLANLDQPLNRAHHNQHCPWLSRESSDGSCEVRPSVLRLEVCEVARRNRRDDREERHNLCAVVVDVLEHRRRDLRLDFVELGDAALGEGEGVACEEEGGGCGCELRGLKGGSLIDDSLHCDDVKVLLDGTLMILFHDREKL